VRAVPNAYDLEDKEYDSINFLRFVSRLLGPLVDAFPTVTLQEIDIKWVTVYFRRC